MNESNSSIDRPHGDLPLPALRAFEAAARLGSFRAASEALGLTPSAISHQVRTLERALGAPLFQKQGRAVILSEAGARLAPFVNQGFAAFARGAALVRGGARARQIRISALAMFNQLILIPNLAGFAARWPDYDVHIQVTPRFADFDREDIDVAIRVGDGKWPGLKCHELFRISGVPVATPNLIADRKICAPRDLLAQRLIHDAAQPRAWSAWLAAQGLPAHDERGDLWFDSSAATLQAAEQDLGVALAIDPLVRLWPAYGTGLVRLFPKATGPHMRYWLAHRAEATAEPKIRAVVTWLRRTCRELQLGT